MSKIKIQDDSGDKKYFTIIPNYIFNHSTIWDREVYCQMKRIAGEEGTCFMSINNLKKRCGIGTERLKKSITYLIEHNWIDFLGKKDVSTKGGIQQVSEYKINDLWKMNIDFYKNKGGSPQEALPNESERGVAVDLKGGSPQAHKKNHSKEEPYTKEEQIFLLSEFKNVSLKEGELKKLNERFGEKNSCILIEELGGYLASTGKKYNSHYATLLNWGRRRIQEYKQKSQLRSIASINNQYDI